MRLSDNFTLEELIYSETAEKNGVDNTPSEEIIKKLKRLCVKILQPIRDKYGDAIYVRSGYRCDELNKLVGGSKTSQHRKGEAADIVCKDNGALWEIITGMIESGEIVVGQLINEYNLSWIHVSFGTKNQVFEIS